jgi:two-component system, cell cycle response regulator DivK
MGSIGTAWVLVIEDLRDQAELLSDVCAEAGLNAMTAATGAQGCRRARDTRPAAILLDLVLPDVDGWDVCRQLKSDERTKHIPIVILTAREEPHGARRARQAGCAAYLKKPCVPSALVSVLKRVIEEHQAV